MKKVLAFLAAWLMLTTLKTWYADRQIDNLPAAERFGNALAFTSVFSSGGGSFQWTDMEQQRNCVICGTQFKSFLPHKKTCGSKPCVKQNCKNRIQYNYAKNLIHKAATSGLTGKLNLVGCRFGRLVVECQVESPTPQHKRYGRYWKLKCDCGNTVVRSTGNLETNTISCGCARHAQGRDHPSWCGAGRMGASVLCSIVARSKRIGKRDPNKKPFNLTKEGLWELFEKQGWKCAISGVPLMFCRNKAKFNSMYAASLDRIDSSKGYTMDNVQWTSLAINWLKSTLTTDQVIALCKTILKYQHVKATTRNSSIIMIKLLTFTNVKGRSGTYKLAPCTVFIGQNAQGKSAVLESLSWAMIGYTPRLRSKDSKGVPNSEMFRLCSGSYMAVRMEADAGVNWRRIDQKRSRDGELSYSKTEDAPVLFNPVLIDSQIYFGLSPAARVSLVASLVKDAGAAGLSVPEILSSIKNIKLETNSPASENAILAAYNRRSDQLSSPPLEWLQIALDDTKESHKQAMATRKRMTSTVTGLTQLQLQDSEQATAASGCEARLTAVRAELGVLQAESGRLNAMLADARKKQARRDALMAVIRPGADITSLSSAMNTALEKCIAKANELGKRDKTAAQLWGEVTKLEAELAAAKHEASRLVARREELEHVQKPDADIAALAYHKATLEARVKEMEGLVAARSETTEKLAERVATMQADKKNLGTSYTILKQQIEDAGKEAKAFLSHDHCPMCLAMGGDWKRPWTVEHDRKMTELSTKLQDTLNAGTKLKGDIDTAQVALYAYKEQDARLAETRQNLSSTIATLSGSAVAAAAYKNAQEELTRIGHELTANITNREKLVVKGLYAKGQHDFTAQQDGELARLQAQHKEAESALMVAQEGAKAWNEAQKELAQIGEPLVGAAGLAVSTNASDIEAKRKEVAELEQQMKTVELARADLRRQMEAVTAAENSQAEVDVLTSVKKLLEKKQADLVAIAFKSLLDITNRFTSALIPHAIEYVDGEVGYRDPAHGIFVTTATFNDAWQLVLYVGLCVSLASAAENRVVVIDRLSDLDVKNKRALAERLLLLVDQGVIHQAIVADLDGEIYQEIAAKTPALSVINV